MPQEQHAGSWTTGQFSTTGASWTIGWAYACSRLTSGPALQIYDVTSGAKSPVPVVTEEDLSGSGTTTTSGSGQHVLQIEANPYCTSATKVVGVAP